ncbi:MAG: S41 family peptidase [Akkermansiaceae bacterium]
MIRHALLVLALSLALGSFSSGVEKIHLPVTSSLTPDGKTIVFAWNDDLWSASISGGEATRLTFHSAPDENPKISHDGKHIFFNSGRTGSNQVFRMPIVGGSPKQITFHSEGSLLEDLHPKKPVILVSGLRDHSGRRPYRLIEKPLDPNKDEQIVFNADGRNGRYSPDGKRILFVRGGAPTYRKGYHGHQAARIWIYDRDKKSFIEPVKDSTGCRYPLWAKDGKSFYYVTSRSGAFNIWQHQLGKKKDRQLTKFPDDSVFAPTLSKDGKSLVFRHLFHLHHLSTKPGSSPKKIELYHRTTLEHPETETFSVTTTRDATVTPTGLEWAFTSGGEIWAMDTVLKEPHRLTNSPAIESDIYFSHGGKHLYFKKDNGITVNYHRMSRTNAKDFWWTAESFETKAITKGPKDKWGFSLSPDEKHIAWIEYPGTLMVAKPDGSEARPLLEKWDSPSYAWSPKGKYLAYSVEDENYNSDVFIVATDGKSEPVNVSRHPDSDYSPKWSPDGKTLAFVGRRHSTNTDLFFVHLDRVTHFRSDREARLESARKAMSRDPQYEPEEKKEEAPKEGEKKEETEEKRVETPKDPGLQIDFNNLHKRIQRIKLNGLNPGALHWMPDSKNLIFQSGGNIYRVAVKAGSKAAVMVKASGNILHYKENDKIYFLSNGLPAFLNRGKVTTYGFKLAYERDRSQHQRLGYRIAWRALRDRFYDPALNNRDWNAVREKYETVAANASSKDTFGRVMALLLGELNASHMGFYPNDFPNQWKYKAAWQETTAHLGVRLDATRRVVAIHPNGPADRPSSRLFIGDLLLKVNGEKLTSGTSLTKLLTGQPGQDITLTVKGKDDKENREVVIRPISYAQARALASATHLDDRRKRVEDKTKDTLGYLHIARMMWDEFEKFEQHIYERGAGKDGLIIDVRDNGGGFTTDHLLTVLTQPVHAFTIGRNGKPGYPQDRLVYASWNKPIVVLCNENSFSNAEIFSHAIKTLDRGRVVGIPTAGGVISTGSATILDIGRIRMPGRGWFLPQNGEDMELFGAVPHVIIDVRPGDLQSGKDPQLDKAIEVLKKEVKERSKKLAPAIYNSQRKK